ncbi:MAG: glucosyl-3-phosphoglycerate synthase [Proteobacteria bacterium]|nr:glucosyl-3-phosphoglycerate synthase [Pseudomonadota bacterium]
MDKSWLEKNTFHHSEFKDLDNLVEEKRAKNLKLSLCLPTLNEEKTIAKEIVIMKSELMTNYPLLDEIIVIDSGSKDKTADIAEYYGADVYLSDDILPDLDQHKGKGENLWKALYISNGDVIIYLDTDIKNIHHRFAYALVGPLLRYDHVKYCKAFYDRPISDGEKGVRPTGGGRVTELVVRPMFSLFFPELTQIMQPLSGEYSGYREIFEKLPFPIGYGIETSMLLDIYRKWGLDVIAQVDLDRRIHRNQTTKALGKMSFVIMQRFLSRLSEYGLLDIGKEVCDEMIQYSNLKNEYQQEIFKFERHQRPPMIEISEYRKKFGV